MEPAGPGLSETRRGGWYSVGNGWRATVLANYTPVGAPGQFVCENHYYMSDNSARAEGYIAPFAVGNHEYAHMAHWWLDDQQWVKCSGTTFIEGWADGFLSAISEMSDDVADSISGYNNLNSIESIHDADPQWPAEQHALAGAMNDFWDGIALENHGGHTWQDPATGIWHDAWEMMDQEFITTVCGFRNTWVAQGRPADGVTVMNHAGVLACP